MSTYLIYKPYGMLSQFTRELPHHVTLADLGFVFEKDVYPVGRLDADSEGLLLLSNQKELNQALLHPKKKQAKTYWVQVEGRPQPKDLGPLEKGVDIKVKGKIHSCLPAEVKILKEIPELPERNPPIRVRKNIPDTWISIAIQEGKNRQVRKMMAAVGFPVLRLVRAQLLDFQLGAGVCSHMQSGQVIRVSVKI